MHGNILIVDDDPAMCEMLVTDLSGRGFFARSATSAEQAFPMLVDGDFDVVLTDLRMPGENGISLCQRIVENRPDMLVIAITAFGSLDTAVSALRAGAYDFISKPVDLDALAHALNRAVQHRDLLERVKVLGRAVEESQRFDELLGSSPPMKNLYDLMGRVADLDSSVLLTGESGTGKEVAARALHHPQRPLQRPFCGHQLRRHARVPPGK